MKKSIVIFGALAMAAGSAFASTYTAVFVDPGSNIGSGYYLSPYTGTITPAGGQTSTVALYCDDFNHEVTSGNTWSAYVTSVLSSDLSNTLYGVTNANPSGPAAFNKCFAYRQTVNGVHVNAREVWRLPKQGFRPTKTFLLVLVSFDGRDDSTVRVHGFEAFGEAFGLSAMIDGLEHSGDDRDL